MYYVYILTNPFHTVLYVGFTSDLAKRTWQHKQKIVKGFSQKYNTTILVYYEHGEDRQVLLEREKQIKDMRRDKKISLIESLNPKWEDLYSKL